MCPVGEENLERKTDRSVAVHAWNRDLQEKLCGSVKFSWGQKFMKLVAFGKVVKKTLVTQ